MSNNTNINASDEATPTTVSDDVTAEKDGGWETAPAPVGGHGHRGVRLQSGLKAGGEWGVGRRTPRS